MSTYSPEQQIHSLSAISNAAFGLKFPNFAALQSYVSQVVSTTLTDDQGPQTANYGFNYLGSTAANTAWQLVWGPVVFSNNPDASSVVADNTMALYYNQSQNLFVVGIAGTNVVSVYGWETEDFDVSTTVQWNTISAQSSAGNDAAIATGTSLGLKALLNMQDANNANRTMIQQLQYFLQNSVTTANPQVAVAGHSLGGALTPVMALYLYENMTDWNTGPNQVTVVSAYPTAGPTQGNDKFAAYYESKVGASFVYTSKYNNIDMIPQVWELDTMVTIPFLYDGGSDMHATTPPDCMVAAITYGAIGSSANTSGLIPYFNKYTQITPRTQLPGQYESISNIVANSAEATKIYKGLKNLPYLYLLDIADLSKLKGYAYFLQNLGYFLIEAAYQHTAGYNGTAMLNIQEFVTEYQYIKGTIPGPAGSDLSQHALLISNIFAAHPILKNVGAFANMAVETGALAES